MFRCSTRLVAAFFLSGSLLPRWRALGLSLCLLLGCLAIPAGPAAASPVALADLLDAKADYRADFYLESGTQGSYRGSMVHIPGQGRWDFESRQGRQALLVRRALDEASLLWPDRKWYLSSSFSAVSGLIGGFEGVSLDRRKRGSEVISGEPCTRYEVTGAMGGGDFHGRIWVTADGILMKAVGTVRFGGRDLHVDTGLINLQRGRVDRGLFVRPADYAGMPLDLGKLGVVP